MRANIEAKKLIVEEIKQKLSNAKSVAFVNYRGLKVETDVKMRKALREKGAEYKVYKNRLMLRALNDLGLTGCDKFLEDTIGVTFCYDDEVSGLGILAKTIDDAKVMEIKFGIVDGKIVDAEYIKTLSKLPSKETLLAMLLGLLKAPIGALARGLDAIAKKQAE